MKLGFVGLGVMGQKMALNLQKAGHDLFVYDMSPDAVKNLVDGGAVLAAHPKQIAEECEVIFTSLPGPKQIESVVFGPDGLLEGIREGICHFDLTTSSQSMSKRVNSAYGEKGAFMLDAPVSGGPAGAEKGTLAIWVGGDEDKFTQHLPLLNVIGNAPALVGEIGAGTVAKLVHNCAGYAINAVMAEVFSMGVKAGVEPVDLWQAVRKGVLGRIPVTDLLTPQFLPGKFSPPSFALNLAHKDVSLAVAMGRELSVPMRLSNMALEEMTEAMNRGWGQLDSRSFMQLQTERAGVEIKGDPERIKAILAEDK